MIRKIYNPSEVLTFKCLSCCPGWFYCPHTSSESPLIPLSNSSSIPWHYLWVDLSNPEQSQQTCTNLLQLCSPTLPNAAKNENQFHGVTPVRTCARDPPPLFISINRSSFPQLNCVPGAAGAGCSLGLGGPTGWAQGAGLGAQSSSAGGHVGKLVS